MNLRNKLTLANANPNESTPLNRTIFFIVVGVAFYMLDRFNLFIVDDYHYTYNFVTGNPIGTLKDIIESQCDHYIHHNGRFLVHCVVQLFCGILGVEWFRIFNTIMFVLFCAMTTRLVCGTYRAPITWYVITTFIIWLFIPRIGFTILGNISFCVNYLWAGVASLAFILEVQKINNDDKSKSFASNISLSVLGAIIGSLQESFSIPISGALFFFFCFNINKFRGPIVWLVCGYWLGSIALVVAPGNFVRLQTVIEKENTVIAIARRLFTLIQDFYQILIVVFICHIVMWRNEQYRIKQFIMQNVLYYGMLVIGLLFAIVVAYKGEHQLFYLGWLGILLIMKLIYTNSNVHSSGIKHIIIGIICACMIPMYGYAYKYRANDYEIREQFIQAVIDSDDGNVAVGNWYANEMNKSCFSRRYSAISPFEPWKHLVSLYYTGDIMHLINYVPCNMIDLHNYIISNEAIIPNVWYFEDYYCFVAKVPCIIPINKVKIEVRRPDSLVSKIKRKLTNEPSTYTFTGDQIMDIVQDGGYNYYIIWEFYYNPVVDVQIDN